MTPEGRVKEKVKKILAVAPVCYYHMPVQNGMGRPSLDFIGCSYGRYFAIEAKAPGKEPTPRQKMTIEEITFAKGTVFVIDGSEVTLGELEAWLYFP